MVENGTIDEYRRSKVCTSIKSKKLVFWKREFQKSQVDLRRMPRSVHMLGSETEHFQVNTSTEEA